MTARPRVAVSPCRTPAAYQDAIANAGGEPVLLRADQPAPDLLHPFHGLLLPGGHDVDPAFWGEPPHPSFTPSEPGRDHLEMELVGQAFAANVPLLAICRGIQLLNVARGGTLYQDIPDQLPSAMPHGTHEPRVQVSHLITVSPGSLIERLLAARLDGHGRCPVDSLHHQAVKAPGDGLVISATAPDGIVEALEAPSERFCLGVQWHPERAATGEFSAIFEGFVEAARRTS